MRKRICFIFLSVFFAQVFFGFIAQRVDAIRLQTTTWYLRNTTASATFGTTGPSAEYSSVSDLVTTSPAAKKTALAMSETPGTTAATITATETTATAGTIWVGTFLSPKLLSQTLDTGAVFRFEGALNESNLAADMVLRINVYLWRQGTGYVQTIFDGVSSTNCGVEPPAAATAKSQVCLTPATTSDVSIQDGDQIALEVWINTANVLTTSYSGYLYDNGITFIGNGTTSHTAASPRSTFSVSQYLYSYTPSSYSTVWYLRSDNSINSFGTTGPSSEYSAGSDLVTTSPSGKSTALSMLTYPGGSQTNISFVETKTTTGTVWLGTFLSPLLASQTIPVGTTFRFENAFKESSLSANFIERIHIYQWREGSGYVMSLFDGVPVTNCGAEPGVANSEMSEICLTTATTAAATIQNGDQIALEVWVYANNVTATSFTGNLYYEGNSFIENGSASHVVTSAMSALYISANVALLSTITTDIVNSSGASVSSPSIGMEGLVFSDLSQVAQGVLGTSDQKIRVSNWSSNNTWTLSLAATDGSSALWDSGGNYYDYNDHSGEIDGSDSDSFGGQLTIDPSVGVLSPSFGCSDTSGLSKGSENSFDQELSVSSISLLIAGSLAPYNCAWDFTGVPVNQKVPSRQLPGTYGLNLMLTIL